MKKINEYELIIFPGKIPIWRLVIASALLTLVLYYLYLALTFFYYLGFTEMAFKSLARVIKLITYPMFLIVSLSMTKTILIDTDKDKLISRYQLSSFSKDVLSKIPELEYVAVFFNSKEEFEVNLWYQGNKHYQMYRFEKKEEAMNLAMITSTKLNIDVLDATV
ncbi:hypothetical protein [Flavobacterium aciduliphilum]|uniref:PH (Pleckstrin Homology) domain-containing protein n=1 Tax=Flavobacterium aciduliphilum TaxID=1101402 RepID=A0A328YKH2_9FLAO|nr:hypothetical protein [Flavobacterium aciduliphilum]RAR72572.1 hypothetical protein CLV55_105142 [Flavobacterium aciduliphilum]